MNIPDGYALVPLEPTEEMLHAYRTALKQYIESLTPEERKKFRRRGIKGIDLGYRLPEQQKAIARYKAMVLAAQNNGEISMEKEISCTYMVNGLTHTEIHGVFAGPVTRQDIIKAFGNGNAGHRFVFFGDDTFIYVKYDNTEEMA